MIHANHARELTGGVVDALARLSDAGIPLLNQSVLLRGVNDDVDALVELCERLVDLRVMPYYLHQLDRVAGAAHFEVDPSRGLRLVDELRAACQATPCRATCAKRPVRQAKRFWHKETPRRCTV